MHAALLTQARLGNVRDVPNGREAPMQVKARRLVMAAIVLAALSCGNLLSGCGKSCTYEGRTYEDGEEWACSDGCNTCMCVDGELGATRLACGRADGGM